MDYAAPWMSHETFLFSESIHNAVTYDLWYAPPCDYAIIINLYCCARAEEKVNDELGHVGYYATRAGLDAWCRTRAGNALTYVAQSLRSVNRDAGMCMHP